MKCREQYPALFGETWLWPFLAGFKKAKKEKTLEAYLQAQRPIIEAAEGPRRRQYEVEMSRAQQRVPAHTNRPSARSPPTAPRPPTTSAMPTRRLVTPPPIETKEKAARAKKAKPITPHTPPSKPSASTAAGTQHATIKVIHPRPPTVPIPQAPIVSGPSWPPPQKRAHHEKQPRHFRSVDEDEDEDEGGEEEEEDSQSEAQPSSSSSSSEADADRATSGKRKRKATRSDEEEKPKSKKRHVPGRGVFHNPKCVRCARTSKPCEVRQSTKGRSCVECGLDKVKCDLPHQNPPLQPPSALRANEDKKKKKGSDNKSMRGTKGRKEQKDESGTDADAEGEDDDADAEQLAAVVRQNKGKGKGEYPTTLVKLF